MIDVAQWRASIGQWYCHSCHTSYGINSLKKINSGLHQPMSKENKLQLLSLVKVNSFLLIISGDVEINPGPETHNNVENIRRIIKGVLQRNHSKFSPALQNSLRRTAEHMYSKALISVAARDSKDYNKLIGDFQAKMAFKESISDLENLCRLFLSCLSCQSGPPQDVAQILAKEWKEEVLKEAEILLTFDYNAGKVLLNPQSLTDSPTEIELMELLRLVDWEELVHYIPHLTTEFITEIKQKSPYNPESHLAQYLTASTTWKNIIIALLEINESSLAYDYLRKLQTSDIIEGVDSEPDIDILSSALNEVFITFSGKLHDTIENCISRLSIKMYSKKLTTETTRAKPNFDSLCQDFQSGITLKRNYTSLREYCQSFIDCLIDEGGSVATLGRSLAIAWKDNVAKRLNISFDLNVTMLDNKSGNAPSDTYKLAIPDEEKIINNLNDLNRDFVSLFTKLKEELEHSKTATLSGIVDCIKHSGSKTNINLRSYDTIEALMDAADGDLFDFLDCHVLVELAKKYASTNLAENFETHLNKAKDFRKSVPVSSFRQCIDFVYPDPFSSDANIPDSEIKLQNIWNDGESEKIYVLMKHFFTKEDRHLVLKHIKIFPGSVVIKYFMTNDQCLNIQEIITHCKEYIPVMEYVGIFEFTINGEVILKKEEDDSYTFGCGLLNAARDGNNIAVQLLIDLSINVNYCADNNQTPLTLAIANGHAEVAQTLVAAGADVNPKIKRRGVLTPLATAVTKIQSFEIIKYLLDNGAQCNVLINGASILDMATNDKISQLLYQYGALTTEELISMQWNASAFHEFLKLKENFDVLNVNILKVLENLLSAGKIKLAEIKEHFVPHFNQDAAFKSISELFALLQPHYSIFNVHPMKAFAFKFFENDIINNINGYSEKLNEFEKSTQLQDIIQIMNSMIPQDTQSKNAFYIVMKFNSQWKSRSIADVCKLHEYCFASIHQFLSFENVYDDDSKIVCIYSIPLSQYFKIVSLMNDETPVKLLKSVGVSEVSVDRLKLLTHEDHTEQTFEEILQHAMEAKNDLLVQFLVDINVALKTKHSNLESNKSESLTKIYQGLLYASINGDNKTVQSLLDQNLIDVNECARPLIGAAYGNHIRVIETFLSAGVDVNSQDRGLTAVHAAGECNYLELLEYLIIKKADINIRNDHGITALMLASKMNHLQIVNCLLVNNANPNIRTKTGGTALVIASQYGHLSVVNSLLSYKADPNLQANDGATALFVACQNDHIQVIDSLLKNDADPNIGREDGFTTLSAAYQNKNVKTVELLLKHKANPNLQHNDGTTVLMLASKMNYLQIVECLLVNNANPNIKSENGATALVVASQYGHLSVVNSLLSYKADPNLQYNDGATALFVACQNDHIQVIDSLLRNDADPNIGKEDGSTPLMFTCINGNIQIVELLLLNKANPHLQNSEKNTALMFAAYNGHLNIVERLILENVKLNIQNEEGSTAIMLAALSGFLNVIKRLLLEGANPHIQDYTTGSDALMVAAQSGHAHVVQYLLKTKVTMRNNNGNTALILACENHHLQIVETLLAENFDLNVQNKKGFTALIRASLEGDLQIVDCLLAHGAHLNIKTNRGFSALMAASLSGHLEVVDSLVNKGAALDDCNNDGNTSLMLACLNNHFNIIEHLLRKGANFNVQNKYRFTALMLACQNAHLNVVNALLEQMADPNILNQDKYTALMIASQNGDLQIVQSLLAKNAKPDIKNESEMTALMLACLNKHLHVVECLLANNADPNIYNQKKFTALMMMCNYHIYISMHGGTAADIEKQNFDANCTLIIERLLEAKAKPIMTISDETWSSLIISALSNNVDAANILLNKANFSKEHIIKALLSACYVGHPEIIKVLSSKIPTTDLKHKMLLLSCAEGDIAGVISAIYESNVNPDTPLVCGLTPLMVASSCGHIELMDALIQAGADIDKPNNYGNTPLDIVDHEYASYSSKEDVIALLMEYDAKHMNPVDEHKIFLSSDDSSQSLSVSSNIRQQQSIKTQLKDPMSIALNTRYWRIDADTYNSKHQTKGQHIIQPSYKQLCEDYTRMLELVAE